MGAARFGARMATISLGVLGVMAAMLAITGIFGMAAYSLSQRTRDLGIRIALGAQRQEVLQAAACWMLIAQLAGVPPARGAVLGSGRGQRDNGGEKFPYRPVVTPIEAHPSPTRPVLLASGVSGSGRSVGVGRVGAGRAALRAPT